MPRASVLLAPMLAVGLAQEGITTPLPRLAPRASAPVYNFLSATFGDHMVLQAAPMSAMIFGHTVAGQQVTTTFNGTSYTTVADEDGVWRQQLPPTAASLTPYELTFESSFEHNLTATLRDVVFGDVFICGGQSNMQYAVGGATNSSEELAKADNYGQIRQFVVGTGTSSDIPLEDLQTVQDPWHVSSKDSVAGDSAVCFFFGERLADARPGRPIGLIGNNWGGTSVEQWSTNTSLARCGDGGGGGNGDLYNAMIHPYTVGPMAVSGFTWYQGEANTESIESARDYACTFPEMIREWRARFDAPSAYFGFVQLSTWCGVDALPEMREAQMAALEKLDNVGYATNADHGNACNIHPPSKQFCGRRLGDSARGLVYGDEILWKSPTFANHVETNVRASPPGSTATVQATVTLNDVSPSGLTTDIYPANYLKEAANVSACVALNEGKNETCSWAGIELRDSGWLNASVTATADGLVLEAEAPPGVALDDVQVIATSYGWGMIPMLSAYDLGTGLPVLPWKENVTTR